MTKKTVSSVRETLSRFKLMPVVLVAVLVISSMVLLVNFMYHLTKRLGASSQPAAVQSNQSPSGVYVGAGNSVLRIDKQTHKVIWHYTFKAPPVETCGLGYCNLFVDNFILMGKMLYIPYYDGKLYALDANNGMMRWSYDFKMGIQHTVSINNDKLYIVSGSAKSYYIYSLNPITGVENKHYGLSSSDSSIIQFPSDGRVQFDSDGDILYANSGNNLYAFNLADGRQIWHQQINQGQTFSGLQVVNGVLYTSSMIYKKNASDYAYAFNAKTGVPIWKSAVASLAFLEAVTGDVMYLSGPYTLYAYDVRNGKELWHHFVGTDIHNIVVNAGTVYVAGGFKENAPYRGVIALNAINGSLKWKTPDNQKSPNFADPASGPILANNTLYAGGYRTLYALNTKGGSAMWTLDVDSVGIPPVIVTMVAAS